MKSSTRLGVAGLVLAIPFCALIAASWPAGGAEAKADRFAAAGPRFVLRNARLFDGRDVKNGASLLVEDGRVKAVGSERLEAPAPTGATVIDATGLTVLPGFLDAHTHVFGDAPKDALAFGVTTELDMFTSAAALPAFRKSRESLAGGAEADVFSAGILATAPKGHGTEYGMPIPTLATAAEADAWVAARVAEGSDYIKIVVDDGSSWGFTTPTLDRATVAALIRAAHARKKLAVVHVSRLADSRAVVEDGADGLVHVFSDELADDAFLALAKARGTFVVPTLTVEESISGATGKVQADPDLFPFVSSTQRAFLKRAFPMKKPRVIENALANVRLLARAGIPILAGTDASNPGTAHGASLHRELELLVSAGLSPVEALRSATSLPAARFGIPERGLLSPGMRADLLIVEGDPTANILATRKIAAIYKNGRFVARARVADAAPAAALPAGALGTFEDGTVNAAFGSAWQPTSDAMRGGASSAKVSVVAGGAKGTSKALRVEGEIKAGFPYPWAGAMLMPGTPPFSPVDASSRRELVFFARGDGKTYRVMIFSSSAPIPVERTFEAKEAFTEVRFPLAEIPGVDWKGLQAIGFSAGSEPRTFALEVDEVELR